MGKGVALRDAFSRLEEFSPDIVVTLDADGQHDPSQIPQIIEPILSGKSDMVIGSRYLDGSRTDPPKHRRFGLWIMNKMTRKASSSLIGDSQSGFRAFSKKALKAVSLSQEKGFGVEQEEILLAFRNRIQIVEVPIDIKYNGLGKTSTKTAVQHGEELLVAIVRLVIEERPLLYIGAPGFVLTLVGFILTAFELWLFNAKRLFDLPIGFAAITSTFVGVLLIVAGLIFQVLTKISELLRKTQT
jgi:glycosyltransferase involved in cell wall biosynthesis